MQCITTIAKYNDAYRINLPVICSMSKFNATVIEHQHTGNFLRPRHAVYIESRNLVTVRDC